MKKIILILLLLLFLMVIFFPGVSVEKSRGGFFNEVRGMKSGERLSLDDSFHGYFIDFFQDLK